MELLLQVIATPGFEIRARVLHRRAFEKFSHVEHALIPLAFTPLLSSTGTPAGSGLKYTPRYPQHTAQP
jgi:hypothetical protein